jgi:hypothetical protein
MRSKKIKFRSSNINLELSQPRPAYKTMPDWYRTIDGVVEGHETIKKCVPFLDAMMAGYSIVTTADVYYDSQGFQEISKMPMVTNHLPQQIQGIPIPSEYSPMPYKWINLFSINTPKGYSTLFTHPLNRIDLPFYTLSGVVDTDKFPVEINFPFFIKKDFSGIIPAGTVIAQAIPFKREDWETDFDENEQAKLPIDIHTMHNPPFGYYKRKFWSRKKYH